MRTESTRGRPVWPGLLLASLVLAACATRPPEAARVQGASAPPADVVVPERYVSRASTRDELDSLAPWPTADGGLWLVATAKSTHRLVVFDGLTGARLDAVGGKGTGPRGFLRPNGIAAWGEHLFVVERDGRRVQVFRLPGFEPAGVFGGAELRSPYGIWLRETAPGELEVFVSDSYMLGAAFDVVPPVADLDERVRRYAVALPEDGPVVARYRGAFGDTGRGALRMVESLAGDPATGMLLVADEHPRGESTLRVYRMDGTYAGHDVPADFDAEAEGVALWDCGVRDDGGVAGYWIAADQLQPRTRFHVLERASLAHVGTFTGEAVAWTDGLAVHAASAPGFPHGALFAVHDDRAVAAFDLGDVARALALDGACLR